MPLPAGVSSHRVTTSRLDTHYLHHGPTEATTALVLVHGNVSSSRFFAELMANLPDGLRVIAPDFRSYGDSEDLPIDATRGVRDLADDTFALLDALGLETAHLLGWSVGGGVVLQMATDQPARVATLTLEASMSPYGFGGTKGPEGTPCTEDYAGTGGGTANPDFVSRLAAGDRTTEADTSPLKLLHTFYVAPPLRFPEAIEQDYLTAMLKTGVGDHAYPGDLEPSEHWPGVRPGTTGMNNAISGKFCNLESFADIEPRPPVLWIRGADDGIVSDASFFDLGNLGKLGLVPGWPGDDAFPPQPMLTQLRALLERYAENGGAFEEIVYPSCGHSPHLEHAETFRAQVLAHIGVVS